MNTMHPRFIIFLFHSRLHTVLLIPNYQLFLITIFHNLCKKKKRKIIKEKKGVAIKLQKFQKYC